MSTPSGSSDPDQTRRDIQQTRADLGETVAALTAKTDVKTRARTKATTTVGGLRQRVTQAGQSAKTRATQLAHTVSQKASERATSVKQNSQHTIGSVRGSVKAGAQTTGKTESALLTSARAATTKIGTSVRAKPVPVLAATGTAATLAIVAYRLRRFR
ncbi:hypothetical protein DKT68_27120 [Micromonospora acroterricola]|uniref:DUF3618 domain-containing protein n=1 Tax=Micromonospora acroterricola TaxID=2202421 RepID=A0A317CSF6_9ACTN|nr:DUF3618 domain-containing protein [Micromonospora acroterricola]PWR05409.1 hypothetical protein DKT68_27120 [Micromonospora acroterricola]